MRVVFEQLAILYVFLLFGWLVGTFKKEKAAHADVLSLLLVSILLPCKVFDTFSKNVTPTYLAERYVYLFASLGLLSVLIAVSLILPKCLTKHPYERKIYTYSVIITNYGYLGYALIGSVFGSEMLSDFMLFAIPFILYSYTAGYVTLTGGKKPFQRLLNPVTIAIVLGIACGLTGLRLPTMITSVVSVGSACVGPLSMLLTGITLSSFAFKELLNDKNAYLFSFLRLIGIPGLAYLVCRLVGLDAFLPLILIITCMPCGLNTIVFPKLIGEDCRLGARLALITHVFSMITLPFWLSLI